MFNFFNRNQEQNEYVVIARYREGDWFRRFVLTDRNAYQACRRFDQAPEFQDWTRVSNASLED